MNDCIYTFWRSCALLGEQLAFATGNQTQAGSIMLQQGAGRAEAAKGTVAGDKFPAWFPDGRRLVVAAGPCGQERLVHIDVQSGGRAPLTDKPHTARGAEARPAVSPDGRRLAFDRTGRRSVGDGVRRPSSEVYDLHVLDLDDRYAKLLVQEVCFAVPASWLSYDQLAYGTWTNGECAVFLYDLASDVATRLPDDF